MALDTQDRASAIAAFRGSIAGVGFPADQENAAVDYMVAHRIEPENPLLVAFCDSLRVQSAIHGDIETMAALTARIEAQGAITAASVESAVLQGIERGVKACGQVKPADDALTVDELASAIHLLRLEVQKLASPAIDPKAPLVASKQTMISSTDLDNLATSIAYRVTLPHAHKAAKAVVNVTTVEASAETHSMKPAFIAGFLVLFAAIVLVSLKFYSATHHSLTIAKYHIGLVLGPYDEVAIVLGLGVAIASVSTLISSAKQSIISKATFQVAFAIILVAGGIAVNVLTKGHL
jgi:hypothetical protein